MNKVLELAQSFEPNQDPMATLMMLAKTHTSAEIAKIIGIARTTLATFLSKNGIKAQNQDRKVTGAKISAAKSGSKQHVDDKVMLFKCDKASYGCGKNKPIILRDVNNPKICALCAKNRRRNLV
jgi:hypothetical protein